MTTGEPIWDLVIAILVAVASFFGGRTSKRGTRR